MSDRDECMKKLAELAKTDKLDKLIEKLPENDFECGLFKNVNFEIDSSSGGIDALIYEFSNSISQWSVDKELYIPAFVLAKCIYSNLLSLIKLLNDSDKYRTELKFFAKTTTKATTETATEEQGDE